MLVNPSGDAWHSKRSKKLPDTDDKLENQFFLVHLNYNDKNDRLTVTTLLSCFFVHTQVLGTRSIREFLFPLIKLSVVLHFAKLRLSQK